MWILDLKGKVFFGLRQEMDSETLEKGCSKEMAQNGQRSDHRMFYDL